MDTLNLGPAEPGAVPAASRRFGRTKRIAATFAAGAVLLGTGAAIGIALTGGASASTAGSPSASSQTAGTPAGTAAAKCARLLR